MSTGYTSNNRHYKLRGARARGERKIEELELSGLAMRKMKRLKSAWTPASQPPDPRRCISPGRGAPRASAADRALVTGRSASAVDPRPLLKDAWGDALGGATPNGGALPSESQQEIYCTMKKIDSSKEETYGLMYEMVGWPHFKNSYNRPYLNQTQKWDAPSQKTKMSPSNHN